MSASASVSSTRLQRAAAAEQRQLARVRARVQARAGALRDELDRLERELADIDARDRLLAELTGAPSGDRVETAAPRAADPGRSGAALLRGTAIRETAVRVACGLATPRPLHYREWYELLVTAGYEIAGKDPLAVFLTQLSRSPVVRKTTRAGVYEVDRDAPARLRRELEQLQEELRGLARDPRPGSDVGAWRERREELVAAMRRVERALEEASRSLAPSDTVSAAA